MKTTHSQHDSYTTRLLVCQDSIILACYQSTTTIWKDLKHLTVCKVYLIVNQFNVYAYISIYLYIFKELKEIVTINVMWTVALGIWHWYQIKIWISLVQNKFCLCLSFLEKEMNSAEPFALKKMMMFMPRSNLCWRYYKHLQFLPYICTFFLRTGRPGATTFFSAPPFLPVGHPIGAKTGLLLS